MTDVVVVGGGVIGLAVAWEAARAGMDVTVCDPAPGRGASWAAAGMLAPVTEARHGEEALLRLNRAGADRWPRFAAALEAATGTSVAHRTTGTVVAALDADDALVLDDLHALLTAQQLPVERVRARELRRLEPALHPSVRAGLHVPSDHQVDSRRLVAALRAACRATDVTVVERAVAGVGVRGTQVTGVTLDDGSWLPARHVVVAAGWDSARLDGLPAEDRPPVRPVKGQVLRLRDHGPVPLVTRTVRGLARGRPVYVVPREDGEVVVGATVEELGADTAVTAGATFELLRTALELLPGLAELELVETRAGLRPGTPDNAPVIGPTSVDGLLLATGHFRHGVLLAPLTAVAVTALLTGGTVPAELTGLGPERFHRRSVGGRT